MKKYKNYLIIIFYGIFLILLFLGTNKIYGSNIDWFNQHVTIPEYFRNLFYETGNLIPNFAFNLGAGQNIFNFSYYGLLSPIILISYFFPFLKMSVYIIIASVFLYLWSGILIYIFINNNFHNPKYSLLASLMLLSFSPLSFHFHHHIMFVWYIPFLILSLINIDKYILKNKCNFLIISIFLIIMTNYYYSITCLLVIFLYYIYKLLKLKKLTFIKIIKIILIFLLSILLSSIILIPTAYTILNGSRTSDSTILFKDFLIPNLKEILYSPFSLGITGIFIIAVISNLCLKKKDKGEFFLNISLLLIISFPIIMYTLNGFLYIRGKILIPFIILFIYEFINFLTNYSKNKIKVNKMLIILFLVIIIFDILNFDNLLYSLELIIFFILFILFKNKLNIKFISIFTLISLFISSFVCNYSENYLSLSKYNNINLNIFNQLSNNKYLDFYRSNNNYDSNYLVNKIYNENYYSPNIYSSTFNKYYSDFYNSFGNNIEHRNILITSGTDNEIFNTFMGVRYIIDKKEGLYYKKMKKKNNIKLLENKNAFPIIYIAKNTSDINNFKNLKFPYNIEFLMNNTVVKKLNSNFNYKTNINKIKLDKNKYNFTLKKDNSYNLVLDKNLKNKIVYLSFDMNYNQSCNEGDVSITINNVKNKLTCSDWKYHNKNYQFKYVISLNNNKINIKITKGKYKINNVKMYYSQILKNDYQSLENIEINKKNSIIKCYTYLHSNNYLVTSIPYDEGFDIYVNGQKKKKELVNTAFLGVKLKKGKNNIIIKYNSPYFNLGLFFSILGFILFLIKLVIF